MTQYYFRTAIRAAGLRDELLAAGIAVALVNPDATGAYVDLDPADFDRAASVVAAHDPTALDQADAQARQARALVRQTIVAYPGKAGPTAAETVAAVKALCLAVAALYQDN